MYYRLNLLNLILILIGLYLLYSFTIKEKFATSPATLIQLESTSTENHDNAFLCKDCGGPPVILTDGPEYYRRRNYGYGG